MIDAPSDHKLSIKKEDDRSNQLQVVLIIIQHNGSHPIKRGIFIERDLLPVQRTLVNDKLIIKTRGNRYKNDLNLF